METLLRTDVQALCGCSVRHNAKQHLLISCHLQILIPNAALPRWRFCYRRIKASPWNMTMAHKDKGVHLKLSRWNNTICVTVPVNTSTFNAISWHFCTDRLCSGTRRTIRRTELCKRSQELWHLKRVLTYAPAHWNNRIPPHFKALSICGFDFYTRG